MNMAETAPIKSNSKQIIDAGNIVFGTSGARGLVVDFTPDICAAFSLAFLSSQIGCKRVAIAIDNRPSSPDMAAYCIAAVNSVGIAVDYYGVIPTPALALTSMGDGIPAIMVTGSHIPFDRNGLKFYRPDGEISKADEQAILNAEVNLPAIDFNKPLPETSTRAAEQYIARNVAPFSADLLAGKRIGIYEHSSAGRDLYGKLFMQLGAEVVSLGRSDQFVPIDTEAVAASDIVQAQEWQQAHGLDAIFSTDGDGDRPLLSDETGYYLRGDILCLLAAQYLNIDALAVPVSCNSAIEQSTAFSCVTRTQIGSPYVIAAFSELQSSFAAIAGFEANGGFLLGSDVTVNGERLAALPTRDALLPAISVLAMAGQAPISSLLQSLPASFTASDRLQDFARTRSDTLLAQAEADPDGFLAQVELTEYRVVGIDKTDGLRMTLDNGVVLHLRPSGNAPELRCYVESDSQTGAQELVAQVLSRIAALT